MDFSINYQTEYSTSDYIYFSKVLDYEVSYSYILGKKTLKTKLIQHIYPKMLPERA